jgi:hypothetical protein
MGIHLDASTRNEDKTSADSSVITCDFAKVELPVLKYVLLCIFLHNPPKAFQLCRPGAGGIEASLFASIKLGVCSRIKVVRNTFLFVLNFCTNKNDRDTVD